MDISSNQILQVSIEARQVNLKYATKLDLIDSLLGPFLHISIMIIHFTYHRIKPFAINVETQKNKIYLAGEKKASKRLSDDTGK